MSSKQASQFIGERLVLLIRRTRRHPDLRRGGLGLAILSYHVVALPKVRERTGSLPTAVAHGPTRLRVRGTRATMPPRFAVALGSREGNNESESRESAAFTVHARGVLFFAWPRRGDLCLYGRALYPCRKLYEPLRGRTVRGLRRWREGNGTIHDRRAIGVQLGKSECISKLDELFLLGWTRYVL